MNIFYCHSQATVRAASLDNLRLNKMILESTQILCTAASMTAPSVVTKMNYTYRPTHRHHPCVKWVAGSEGAFLFLLREAFELIEEKYIRDTTGGKAPATHKCRVVLDEMIHYLPMLLPSMCLEDFYHYSHNPTKISDLPPNCSGFPISSDDFADYKNNLISNYQKLLIKKWITDSYMNRPPNWGFRGAPTWAEFNADRTPEAISSE